MVINGNDETLPTINVLSLDQIGPIRVYFDDNVRCLNT